MKLREKIAMIWVAPLMLVIVALTFVLAMIVYSVVFLLKITGTLGAMQYLIDQTRLFGIERRLKKLQKEDEKLYNFGRPMKEE